MKKLAMIFTAFMLVIGLAACTDRGATTPPVDDYDNCETPDGDNPCWNVELARFLWEEGAVITIGVDSDSMGAALVEKWDLDFPDLAGKLQFRNYGSVNGDDSGMQGIELAEAEAPDVALVIDNEVIGREGAVFPLHQYFIDLGAEQTHPSVFAEINILDYFLLPAFYDGMAFAWNQTMLEEWGVDLTDSNENNLPDAFDTWEKIFAMADSYGSAVEERPTFRGEPVLEFFPISLGEPWSGYSSLTAGGWQLFDEGIMDEPGFDKAEFLAGLEFIQAFSQTNMSVDDTGQKSAGDALGWRWDAFLEGAYPFGLVGTWMDVEGQTAANDLVIRFSPMPTFEGNQLTPMMKTKGFVINGFTPYPSAASEVLRWLYTESTMGAMIESSAYLPALQEDAEIFPQIDSQMKVEFAVALLYTKLEPSGTLPNNPAARAMNVYYNIDITDFFIDIWDGLITPEDAQAAIVEAADAWIEANNE